MLENFIHLSLVMKREQLRNLYQASLFKQARSFNLSFETVQVRIIEKFIVKLTLAYALVIRSHLVVASRYKGVSVYLLGVLVPHQFHSDLEYPVTEKRKLKHECEYTVLSKSGHITIHYLFKRIL